MIIIIVLARDCARPYARTCARLPSWLGGPRMFLFINIITCICIFIVMAIIIVGSRAIARGVRKEDRETERVERSRVKQSGVEGSRGEQSGVEGSRGEQRGVEQSRAEQGGVEQAEQSGVEQGGEEGEGGALFCEQLSLRRCRYRGEPGQKHVHTYIYIYIYLVMYNYMYVYLHIYEYIY